MSGLAESFAVAIAVKSLTRDRRMRTHVGNEKPEARGRCMACEA